ncbi:MAG: PilZ domain-containing protein [Terriglobales bacterium]
MSLGDTTGVPIIGRVSQRPNERRRSSRYCCGGLADALRIPIIGDAVKATVSDISLHGCRILTEFTFECGMPLDLLLRVESISFRASGNVKVVRGPAEIGIEFTRLSAGGQRRLTELLAELDRFSSRLGWKRLAPQVIEGEYLQRDVENQPSKDGRIHGAGEGTFALPMFASDTNRAQPLVVRGDRLSAHPPLEVDVFF